jgi:C4-dicarboxylate-binding protein DctP
MNGVSISRGTFLRRVGALGAAFVACPLLTTPARAAAPSHRLVFGHTFGASTKDCVVTGLDLFKELAEKYSGGKLLVDIHEAGSLGPQTVLPQKVLGGSIQGCQVSTQNFARFSDVFDILDLPYLFDSNDQFERTIENEAFMKTEFVTRPAKQGFQVVPGMWANTGFRIFGVSKKVDRVVRRPGDVKGMKVRTNGTRAEEVMFRLTTANPVSISWSEAYQALAQGAADALSVGMGPITAMKIHETLSRATHYDLNFNAHVTVLNKKWFDALPADVKDAIFRAGRESWESQKQEQRKANSAMARRWKEHGIDVVTLSPDEKAEWRAAVGHGRKEYADLKQALGSDALEQLLRLRPTTV